jgi:hypothetical protein
MSLDDIFRDLTEEEEKEENARLERMLAAPTAPSLPIVALAPPIAALAPPPTTRKLSRFNRGFLDVFLDILLFLTRYELGVLCQVSNRLNQVIVEWNSRRLLKQCGLVKTDVIFL